MQTKNGKWLTIRVIFFDYLTSDGQQSRDFILLAESDNKTIVGDKIQQNINEEKQNSIKSGGLICVGTKKDGIAVPIEMVNLDLLQKEANRTGVDVSWLVINGNEGNAEEKKRWEHIYGANGILRIDSGGQKYTPNSTPEDLELIEEITLSRSNGPEIFQETGKINVSEEQKDELRKRKIEDFERYIRN